MTAKEVFLEVTDWIEFHSTYWKPDLYEEKQAALLAYMTGDGTIGKRSQKYVKKNSEQMTYGPTLAGALYSNIESDLLDIAKDCKSIGVGSNASVTLKKNDGVRSDGYQFQIGKRDCEKFESIGCPTGKKTKKEFDVPEWIMAGSSGVKRAYLSALFGAEGSAPVKDKLSKSRFPRQPVLTMCKVESVATGENFFLQLQKLAMSLEVETTIGFTLADSFGKTYRTNWLRVSSGAENLIRFYENIGFTYCKQKSIAGWKWSKYLRTYLSRAKFRRDTIILMRKDGETYESIGKRLSIASGAVWRMERDIVKGKETTAGHLFPHFDEWIKDRWIESEQLLRLEVVGRKFHEDRQVVWNVKVSSPDHSYLLASGANNYNSFEVMAGRVYYPFDRKEHVGKYEFNPNLPIWVGMDFNIDPMSAVIFQPQSNGELWAVDEIVLFGSNTEEVCKEIDKKYWRFQKQIVVYPDPAGGQRQHARGETDLDILRECGLKRIKYRRKHPPVADRVNSVNRMLRAANGTVRMRIDIKCKHLINAFEQTIYKPGTRDVDKTAGVEHSADAGGYCIELEYPIRKIEVGGLSI